MTTLVLVVGRSSTRVPLGVTPITIGRASDNDIVLEHPDVSRFHCRIERIAEGLFRVIDLESTNGTYLNGEPISSLAMEQGDQIVIGQFLLIVAEDNSAVLNEEDSEAEIFPWKPSSSGEYRMRTLPLAWASTETPTLPSRPAERQARKQLSEKTTHRFGLQELLPFFSQVSQQVGSALELGDLLATILNEILKHTEFDRAIILLFDDRTGMLQPVLDTAATPDALGTDTQQFVQHLAKAAIADRQPVFYSASSLDFSARQRSLPQKQSTESALCLPLLVPVRTVAVERRRHYPQRRALGVLYLESMQDIESLNDEEISLIELVAAQVCAALQNAQLHYQATIDPVTRLNNRSVMERILRDEMVWANTSGASIGIILLDLDHFKRINDTYGHAVGDEVLKRLARRITRALRSSDYAFRWGGEEILVLITSTSPSDILGVASKIAEAISSLPIGEHLIAVTASMGVALYPNHGNCPEELVGRADIALYRAKAGGRNRICVYDPDRDRDFPSAARHDLSRSQPL